LPSRVPGPTLQPRPNLQLKIDPQAGFKYNFNLRFGPVSRAEGGDLDHDRDNDG